MEEPGTHEVHNKSCNNYYTHNMNLSAAALHMLTKPRTATREYFRNGPRHRVSIKSDKLNALIVFNHDVMTLGSFYKVTGCIHSQHNTVSHSFNINFSLILRL